MDKKEIKSETYNTKIRLEMKNIQRFKKLVIIWFNKRWFFFDAARFNMQLEKITHYVSMQNPPWLHNSQQCHSSSISIPLMQWNHFPSDWTLCNWIAFVEVDSGVRDTEVWGFLFLTSPLMSFLHKFSSHSVFCYIFKSTQAHTLSTHVDILYRFTNVPNTHIHKLLYMLRILFTLIRAHEMFSAVPSFNIVPSEHRDFYFRKSCNKPVTLQY